MALDRIRREISEHGAIPFARFMERALTEPDLGYYATSALRPTRAGDFLTAPELHPFFGRCLGRFLGECDDLLLGDGRAGTRGQVASVAERTFREVDSRDRSSRGGEPRGVQARSAAEVGNLRSRSDAEAGSDPLHRLINKPCISRRKINVIIEVAQEHLGGCVRIRP